MDVILKSKPTPLAFVLARLCKTKRSLIIQEVRTHWLSLDPVILNLPQATFTRQIEHPCSVKRHYEAKSIKGIADLESRNHTPIALMPHVPQKDFQKGGALVVWIKSLPR